MKQLLLIVCLIPTIAIADPSADFLARHTMQQRSQIVPVPIPRQVAPNGFAIYERERPLPPQWGVDSYRSYKVIPLDRYGQPTQPLITMDEVMNDMLYGALQKNQPKD